MWRRGQALRSVGWLAHRNERGGHVYVRPATTACLLVDGLNADGLAAIRADGLAPAAVVEASPDAFQAWFRLGREVDPGIAVCAARILAARYGDDPPSVAGVRPGRAAGFRNRTAELADSRGRYPLVRLDEARGRVTPKADELVAAAEDRFARRKKERAATGRKGRAGSEKGAWGRPEAYAEKEIARLAARHGAAIEWGRAFGAAAAAMARAGFTQPRVAAALAACPEVRRRRGEDADEYAARIAAWAFGAVRRRPR